MVKPQPEKNTKIGWHSNFFNDHKAILAQIEKAANSFRMSKILPTMSEKSLKDTVRLYHRRRQIAENWPLLIIKGNDLLFKVEREQKVRTDVKEYDLKINRELLEGICHQLIAHFNVVLLLDI